MVSRKLKIVHVTPSFVKGGGERAVISLANEQAARGHDVTIVVGRSHGLADVRQALNERIAVKLIADEGVGKLRAYVTMIAWQLRHRTWLRSRDVVHCHLTMAAVFGTVTRAIIRGRDRPVIVETYHAVGMAIPRPMRMLHARMARTRDALVLMARNDYWDRFAAKHTSMRIETIENGVRSPIGRVGELADRVRYRRDIGIPDDCRYVVGTVGQFRPDRRPWLHVEVFARIAEILGEGVYFVIAGDGTARRRVEDAIADAGLRHRVKLLGITQDAATPASIMDLYVTLAVGPVVGIAALEAIFAAVPTIAIQLSDDYVADGDDFVWSSIDLNAVADRATQLLRSPEMLAAMGARQHVYAVKRYDMAAVTDRYDDVYRSILASRDSPC